MRMVRYTIDDINEDNDVNLDAFFWMFVLKKVELPSGIYFDFNDNSFFGDLNVLDDEEEFFKKINILVKKIKDQDLIDEYYSRFS